MSIEDRKPEEQGDAQQGQDDFQRMLERWGIEIREESKPPQPLSLDSLIEKWCEERFERPIHAVRALKDGTQAVEAAAALFGYCYEFLLFYDDFEVRLEDHIEESRKGIERYRADTNMNDTWREFHVRLLQRTVTVAEDLVKFRDDPSVGTVSWTPGSASGSVGLCVDILLTAARTLIDSGGVRKRYNRYFDDLISKAYEHLRDREVEEVEEFSTEELHNDGQVLDGNVVGLLACIAAAVVCESMGHVASRLRPDSGRNHKIAFMAYVDEAQYLERVGFDIDLFDKLFDPERHHNNSDTSQPNSLFWKAIEAWEQLKKNPDEVHWKQIRGYLEALSGIMWDLELDAEFGEYPEGLPGFMYLPNQIGFCTGRMGQGELHEFFHEVTRRQSSDQHKLRMENDFFVGLWGYLHRQTKRDVISAEMVWYDSLRKGGDVKSAIEYYSKALGTELRYIIFVSNPRVQQSIKTILADPRQKTVLGLTSRSAENLSLRDMAILLGKARDNTHNRNRWPEVRPINEAIAAFPIPEYEEENHRLRTFLTREDFISDLDDIRYLRNQSTHSSLLQRSDVLERIGKLRARILGICCEGYLPRLASIKKLLGASASKDPE